VLGDPPPHVGALDQETVKGQVDVAAVEAAGGGEDAVVGCVEVGELLLAAERLAAGLVLGAGRLGPLRQRRWSDPIGLQLVDPRQ
jgi:hypothetical protein